MPPKVEYTLTDYGVTVNNIVEVMCSWGKENIKMRQQQGENIVLLEDTPRESLEDFRKIDR
ncbi:putative HTH-type transcriptional regulator YtcD [compost metagenome]